MQGIEQHRREEGRWVGDMQALEASLPRFVTVTDRNADVVDEAIAQVPAQHPLALVKGEVDELELQRLHSGKPLQVKHAELKRARFPDALPKGFDQSVEELAPPSRRTLRGHKVIMVDSSVWQRSRPVERAVAGTLDDPRLTLRMITFEKNGAVRMSTPEERRSYFALADRKPRVMELEPIEYLRKYVLTPVYYKGKPYRKKHHVMGEQALLDAKNGVEPASAASEAPQQAEQ